MTYDVSGQSPPLQYSTMHQYTASDILLLCGQVVGWILICETFTGSLSVKAHHFLVPNI